MYQLWIFNTAFNDYQKVGPPVAHAEALRWIVTLRQHFDAREIQLLSEGPYPFWQTAPTVSARSVWPGE